MTTSGIILSSPPTVTGSLMAVDGQGSPAPGVRYQFQVLTLPTTLTGQGVSTERFDVVADADGTISLSLIAGATYVAWAGQVRPLLHTLAPFTVPAMDFAIPSLNRGGLPMLTEQPADMAVMR